MSYMAMPAEPRIDSPRSGTNTALSWILGVFVILAAVAEARATPLENTRVGGLNANSVVEPHPASLYRNPAVLSLLRGTHVFLDGTARLELGRIRRAGIRSDTGVPGPSADLRFRPETYAHITPDLFFAVTSDLGTNRVVLGLAVLTPFAELQGFPDPLGARPPQGAEASRYHRIKSEWYHLFVLPAVAVRIHDRFRFGLGFGYARSMLRMAFARDCAIRSCQPEVSAPPYESPMATERVEVDGTDDSLLFNLGVVVRPHAQVDVALAYRSKVVGVGRSDIKAEGGALVSRFDALAGGWEHIRGRARIVYEIPDALSVGVKHRLKAWDFAYGFEWVRWSVHRDLSFTLTGNAFRAAELANWDINFKRYRGFRDVFRVSTLAGHTLRKGLVLSFGGLFESSAVPRRYLSAGAVDAHKVDLLVALLWRPHRAVGIHLGYSVTLAPELRVDDSGFDPRLTTTCVEDQVDILWSQACRLVSEGKGAPSAAGRYWQMVHRFGLGVSYDYW